MNTLYSVNNLREGITEFFQRKIDAGTPTAYFDSDHNNILSICLSFDRNTIRDVCPFIPEITWGQWRRSLRWSDQE